MVETERERVQRHIQLGKRMIADQKAIIAKILGNHNMAALAQARRLLELLEQSQQSHTEHWDRIKGGDDAA